MIKGKNIRINYLRLAACIVICELAGLIGSIFTTSSIAVWYEFLVKPSFAPPGWFIGTVWTILYFLMGISLYIIWNSKSLQKSFAIDVFGLQLLVNVIWSVLFFGLRSPGSGLVCIIILWIMIAYNILVFRRISKKAASLLLPYIIWVTIASYLNYLIFVLNI